MVPECTAVISPNLVVINTLQHTMTTASTENRTRARADGLARVEDRRLLTGKGLYIHDVHQPGMLHATFLRSTHARASIAALDLQAYSSASQAARSSSVLAMTNTKAR